MKFSSVQHIEFMKLFMLNQRTSPYENFMVLYIDKKKNPEEMKGNEMLKK